MAQILPPELPPAFQKTIQQRIEEGELYVQNGFINDNSSEDDDTPFPSAYGRVKSDPIGRGRVKSEPIGRAYNRFLEQRRYVFNHSSRSATKESCDTSADGSEVPSAPESPREHCKQLATKPDDAPSPPPSPPLAAQPRFGLELVRCHGGRWRDDYIDFTEAAKKLAKKKMEVISPWVYVKSVGGLQIRFRMKIEAKKMNDRKGGVYFKRSGYIGHVQLKGEITQVENSFDGTEVVYQISLVDPATGQEQPPVVFKHDFAEASLTSNEQEFKFAQALVDGHFILRLRVHTHRFEDIDGRSD